jgi:hypothetical protein
METPEQERRIYSIEEIKKLVPGYRGKPENFDPKKAGQKSQLAPKSRLAVAPTSLDNTPIVQNDELLLDESFFGVDITVIPTQPREDFSTSFSRLPEIAVETYNQCSVDERQIDRVIAKEEMSYYATGLLWMKLIDVKAKQNVEVLTNEEKSIRKATKDAEFNVPQPIAAYLLQIGQYSDKMGKTTDLRIPNLPTTSVEGMGGYHAAAIDEGTHNLFEEVPSLGIAGDMVMALCQEAQEPAPNFHIAIPVGAKVTSNLTGRIFPVGPRRQEIKQRLAGQGITALDFPEYVPNTRFSLRYLKSLSDIIGKFETFRNVSLCFTRLTASGGETQVIQTRPTPDEDMHELWTRRSVQATSASDSSTAIMGASFMFGFQTYKEPGEGATATEQHAKWCCLDSIGEGEDAWTIPQEWIDNRNTRRNLPPGIGTERFRTLSKRQDLVLEDVIRRMVNTPR